MKNKNRKSDFKVIIPITNTEFIGMPFTLVFTSGRISSQKFVASSNGKKCVNCRMVDDTHILVLFDNHNLPCGVVECEYFFKVPDADMLDGTFKLVGKGSIGINLTEGEEDPDDAPISVNSSFVINAFRGKNAYELAVDSGFVGTLDEWLELGFGAEKYNELLATINDAKSAIDGKAQEVLDASAGAKEVIYQTKSKAIEELDALKTSAVEVINTASGNAKTDISNALSIALTTINGKVGEVVSSFTLATETGKTEIDGAKTSAITSINSAKESAVGEISPLVGAASASADAAHTSEVNAKNSEDAARQYAEGAEGSAAASLEKVKEAANNALSAASSASVAEQKATEAADHAANVDAALEAIKGSGDIPAATIEQVIENTTAIGDLNQKVGNVKICTGKSYEDFFGVGQVDIAEMGYTAVPISEREYKEF